MAGNHILLPYKIFDAISSGSLTVEEAWEFINALVDYDRASKTPEFPPGEANALWIMIKPEIDRNIENWKLEVKHRSRAGKKGGSSKSEKKVIAARKNGQRGGAPSGNKNAAKTTQADNENVNAFDYEKDPDLGKDSDLDPDRGKVYVNIKSGFDDVL